MHPVLEARLVIITHQTESRGSESRKRRLSSNDDKDDDNDDDDDGERDPRLVKRLRGPSPPPPVPEYASSSEEIEALKAHINELYDFIQNADVVLSRSYALASCLCLLLTREQKHHHPFASSLTPVTMVLRSSQRRSSKRSRRPSMTWVMMIGIDHHLRWWMVMPTADA